MRDVICALWETHWYWESLIFSAFEWSWLIDENSWLIVRVCLSFHEDRKKTMSIFRFFLDVIWCQIKTLLLDQLFAFVWQRRKNHFLPRSHIGLLARGAVIKIKQDSTFDLVNWVCISHGTKIIFQSSTDWFSENNYAWSSRSAKKICLQKKRIFSTMTGFSQLVT